RRLPDRGTGLGLIDEERIRQPAGTLRGPVRGHVQRVLGAEAAGAGAVARLDRDLVLARRQRDDRLVDAALVGPARLVEAGDADQFRPRDSPDFLAVPVEDERDLVACREGITVPTESERAVRQREPEK